MEGPCQLREGISNVIGMLEQAYGRSLMATKRRHIENVGRPM